MRRFTYHHTCPDCGTAWEEHVLEEYKRPHKYKKCYACLTELRQGRVVDLGGLDKPKNCGNCKFFRRTKEDRSGCWGECERGYELENELEYTLTHGIETEGERSGIKMEDHPDYGNDLFGLVSTYDVCSDWTEGDEDDD